VTPDEGVVAGRWPSPPPPWPFVPCGWPPTACAAVVHHPEPGLRGLPTIDARSVARSAAPPWPSPPLRSLRSALAGAIGPKSNVAGRLSWDSSVRPSIDMPPGPGHVGVSTARSRIARSGTGAVHVVSHHLDGSPSPEVAGLLHPAADPEVRRVCCAVVRIPATLFVPLEESPRPAAAPRHRGRCLSCGSPTSRRTRVLSHSGRAEGPRRQMGSGPSIARRTSTHLRRSTGGGRSRRRRAPGRRAGARSDTASVSGGRGDRLSGHFRALLRRRVRADSGPDWIPVTESTVLPGLRSPSRSCRRTPGGTTSASATPTLHAVRAGSRTTGRQARGDDDRRTSRGHRPDIPSRGSPPGSALAGRGRNPSGGSSSTRLAPRGQRPWSLSGAAVSVLSHR